MEYHAVEVNYKFADPNQYKGAPNPYERFLNEDPFGVTVVRNIGPGHAASPPQRGIPMRAGWAAGGDFSHGGHNWYTGEPPKEDSPAKAPHYGFAHRQYVRPSG